MKGPHSGTAGLCLWGLHSCRYLVVALLLLHGSVLFQAYAEEILLEDEDSKQMCFYIKWSVNFSVDYETENNEYKRADFSLPDDAEFAGSDCGDAYANILAVKFGQDNYWNMIFTKSGNSYEGTISFTYNTNDTALFPDAKRIGPVTVTTMYPAHPIQLNTVFTCDGLTSLQTDNVTQYIWEVTLQAFIPEVFLSKAKTHCSQDVPTTPEQPETTREATSTFTIPFATPEASTTPTAPMPAMTTPSMTSTTMPSITLQPWARPPPGTYSVKDNGTICLLATKVLQLNISEQRNTSNEVFFLKEVKITTVGATNGEEHYTSQFRYLIPVTAGGVEAFLLLALFIRYIHRRKKKPTGHFEV